MIDDVVGVLFVEALGVVYEPFSSFGRPPWFQDTILVVQIALRVKAVRDFVRYDHSNAAVV